MNLGTPISRVLGWSSMPPLSAAVLYDPNGRLISSSQSGQWIESTVGGAAAATIGAGTAWLWKLSAWDGRKRVGGNALQCNLGLLVDSTEAQGASDETWVAVGISDGTNLATAAFVAVGITASTGKWYATAWINGSAGGLGAGNVARPDGGLYADLNSFPGNVGGTIVTNWTGATMNASGGLMDSKSNGSPPAWTTGNELYGFYARGNLSGAGTTALRVRVPLLLGHVLTNCVVP